MYPKTCVIRRDKTLLRALRVDMHARQWVTGLHLAAQTTGDEGGLSGGLLQKGVIARLLCMQPLHILCNNTQNSRPLFGLRVACTAPERVDGSALLLLSGKAGAYSGVRGCFQ